MGFRFRRSFKIIPGVRLNLSGSGASVSLGPRGLRYTIGSRGTRTTVGLPGSGLSWTAYQSYTSGDNSRPPDRPVRYVSDADTAEPVATDQGATVIESASIEQLVANSTIDIAGALNASRARWKAYKGGLTVLSALFVIAAVMVAGSASSVPPAAAFVGTAGAVIILGAIWLHGRRASTISLDYDLSADELERFKALTSAFDALAGCRQVWRVPSERQEADWKRNAGAAKTVERMPIALTRGNPPHVNSNVEFLRLPLGKEILYLTPDAILAMAGGDVAAFGYGDVEVECRQIRFIEDGTAPSDAEIVGETWQYLNRKGGPDRRFKNNRQLPICLYGEIDFRSATGLNERIQFSRVDVSEGFASTAAAMRTTGASAASNPIGPSSAVPFTMISPEKNQGSEIVVDVAAAYAQETDLARSLALNHGKFWELLLVEELLRSKLQLLKSDCDDLAKVVPSKLFTGREFVNWVGSECTDLSPVITNMAACIEKDLMDAMGKLGVSGDALRMLSTVNAIFSDCRKCLNFERALAAAEVPSAVYKLKQSFRGITNSLVDVVEDLKAQWSRNTEAVKNGAGDFELRINFKTPPQAQAALAEIEKIKKKSKLL
jgi:hypothetical protein